jgi:geranylgeranyl reductase
MYVGDDVSPDFYGWVFPKYDHVGVGTGTVINRPAIKEYQKAMRARAGEKIAGGKIIKVEAHPIPEHMRPRRVVGRAALVGDAAGYGKTRLFFSRLGEHTHVAATTDHSNMGNLI